MSITNLFYACHAASIKNKDEWFEDSACSNNMTSQESKLIDTDEAQLLIENGELEQKLDTASMIEVELNQRLEELDKVKDTLIMEKEASIQSNEESLKITEDLRTLTDWL